MFSVPKYIKEELNILRGDNLTEISGGEGSNNCPRLTQLHSTLSNLRGFCFRGTIFVVYLLRTACDMTSAAVLLLVTTTAMNLDRQEAGQWPHASCMPWLGCCSARGDTGDPYPCIVPEAMARLALLSLCYGQGKQVLFVKWQI